MTANIADLDIPRQPPDLADGTAGGDGYPFGRVTLRELGHQATDGALEYLYRRSLVTPSIGHMMLKHHPDLSVKFLPPTFSYLPPYYGETALNN